jgi:hypothetical protein
MPGEKNGQDDANEDIFDSFSRQNDLRIPNSRMRCLAENLDRFQIGGVGRMEGIPGTYLSDSHRVRFVRYWGSINV